MNNGIDYREECPGQEGATDEEILILDTLSFFTKKKKRKREKWGTSQSLLVHNMT